MTPTEENRIVERVLAGDSAAFAALVDAYKGAVFNLAFRMTGSRADADDLAQETFIRAYHALERFDPRRRFFTWIYTISLNVVRNHLEKQGRERDLRRDHRGQHATAGAPDSGNPASPELERERDIHRLENALRKLPTDLREAIVLRYYQGLSYEEIAAVSDASVSAVKMRVYRGLERLKQFMDT